MIPQSDPAEWVLKLKFPEMSLSTDLQRKLRARLLMAYSDSTERSSQPGWNWHLSFLHSAFNAIAEELFEAGALSEPFLNDQLQIIVNEAAIRAGIYRGFGVPAEDDLLIVERAKWCSNTYGVFLKVPVSYWRGKLMMSREPASVGAEYSKEDRHAALLAKLDRHIKQAKINGSDLCTIKAFCQSLQNGRGISYRDFKKWRRLDPKISPGYPAIIESAIERLT